MPSTEDGEEAAFEVAFEAAFEATEKTYDIAYDAIYTLWYQDARQLGGLDAIDAVVAAHDYAVETAYELAHEAAYEAAIVAVKAVFATFGMTCDPVRAAEIADNAASFAAAQAARNGRQLSV